MTGPTLDNARYLTTQYTRTEWASLLPHLHATPFDVNVIQIYAPTADKDDAVIEEFYEQLERLIKMTNKQEITIILGVCQAPQEISDSVKETKEETVLYSSARIITYYSKNLHVEIASRLCEKIVRNQIDYIAIPNRFKNSIRSAKTYPGADVPSDHIPVVCRFELRLKRIKKAPSKNNIDIGKLSDRNIRKQVQESLTNDLKKKKHE
ncbi:hypothetical protein HUJ05_002261 [Dendroctonus ponderosae]|nr:hypothetical protein HUJ05_002261 [Dendroctonus ponderosae]